LNALRALALSAEFTPAARQVTLHCTGRLPQLYDGFATTDESRFGEEVTALARTVLKRLGEPGAGADAVVAHLGALHERLGLAPVRYQAPAAARAVKRKRAP
jgi:hypothetical protein